MAVYEFPLALIVIVLYCRLIFIDTDFRTLKLKAEDSSHHQHVFTVKLKSRVRPRIKLIFQTQITGISSSLVFPESWFNWWVCLRMKLLKSKLHPSGKANYRTRIIVCSFLLVCLYILNLVYMTFCRDLKIEMRTSPRGDRRTWDVQRER